MEKFKSKYEHEPLLLKKLEDSYSGDPKGHWASAQTPKGMPRSNNGNESYMGLFKQIVTGFKRLMAADFLKKLATHVKARSLLI